MRPLPILAALALLTGCASHRDRADGATAARFSPHEGRPGREKPAPRPAAGGEGDSWWGSLLGGLIGSLIGCDDDDGDDGDF